jgi:hypothetical protein
MEGVEFKKLKGLFVWGKKIRVSFQEARRPPLFLRQRNNYGPFAPG